MAKLHIRRTIIFIILGIIAGMVYVAVTPKVYEAQLVMLVGNPVGLQQAPEMFTKDVKQILDASAPRNPATELSLLRSSNLFLEALEDVASQNNDNDMLRPDVAERYFSMYDVLGERESEAAYILVRAFSPETAVQLANAVSMKFNERRLRAARTSIASTVEYLQTQIGIAQQNVDRSLGELTRYMEENSIANLESAIMNATSAATTAQTNLETVETEYEASEKEVASAMERLRNSPEREQAERVVQKSPIVTKLEADLTELRGQESQLLVQFMEDSVFVRQVRERIKKTSADLAEAKKELMQETQSIERRNPNYVSMQEAVNNAIMRRDSLAKRVQELRDVKATHEQRLKSLAGSTREMQGLSREVEVKEATLRNLKVQLEALQNRAETSGRVNPAMFPPRENPEPVFPNPLIVGLLAIFGGASLGLLYSFAVESMRLRIYTSYQLADLTGLPVVAALPRIPGSSVRRLEGTLGGASPRILESIRLLAFSLVAQPQEGCRRLLFTGLDRQTGASSSAAQLAVALGQTGARVILVDADLTGRSSSRVFKADGQRGLAEALTSDSSLAGIGELLRDTGSENVKLLPAGISNDRAVKECETKRLEEVITWLSDKCDYLIFDTPPCLRNSEAARLASDTDEVYLVVSLRISTVPLVSTALDIMRQAGANVIRLVTTEGDRGEESLAREARVASDSRALPS